MSQKPVAIVAGAGEGLGQSLIANLTAHGYNAFGLNRTVPADSEHTFAVDLSDKGRLKSAMQKIYCAAGAPSLVVHNTAKLVISPFEETSAQDFEEVWRTTLLSAVHLAHEVLPVMAASGGGTFIFSGATASLRGSKNFSAFSSAKAGLRAFAQSLAKEFGSDGVHVAHVILDGILNTHASRELHGLPVQRMMNLDDVATVYRSIADQPRSAWTFETDLRPMGESF